MKRHTTHVDEKTYLLLRRLKRRLRKSPIRWTYEAILAAAVEALWKNWHEDDK